MISASDEEPMRPPQPSQSELAKFHTYHIFTHHAPEPNSGQRAYTDNDVIELTDSDEEPSAPKRIPTSAPARTGEPISIGSSGFEGKYHDKGHI